LRFKLRFTCFHDGVLPCLIFEDEHLLVVNKPAGLNTHAAAPFAGEGLYEWLRHREPRWSSLAIIHRLDKETSGVIVFGKTTAANQSLTAQFAGRDVTKKYLLLTTSALTRRDLTVKSKIVRTGNHYASGALGDPAETRFSQIDQPLVAPRLNQGGSIITPQQVIAEPFTGRTHQIRVHAAENGFPILGDTLYGGAPFPRVCLHAAELTLRHPITGADIRFVAPARFDSDPRLELRQALIDPELTDAFRVRHGASDGRPGMFIDRLGDLLLLQNERPPDAAQTAELSGLQKHFSARGVWHKTWTRTVGRVQPADRSPQPLSGDCAPDRFVVRENGLNFELSFNEGYSVGLFLDQRDNRRRLLTGHIAANFELLNSKPENESRKPELLNAFAYTCGFSVCAAQAGLRATSLDLSKKYLEWGRRNFTLNGLDPAGHDFIYGDAFDWLKRLRRKNRIFDVIVLDPPTFSQSKEHGAFRVEKDYQRLAALALPLLKPNGVLFASANAAGWAPEKFLTTLEAAVGDTKRKILQQHYSPQPPDFPISRAEPAYLKTVWLRID
jgi:23S rRNA (cytosine1962-C5)-methyltransferase